MFKYSVLILLFAAVFAKTIAPVSNEEIELSASIEDFLKCVHEAEPVVKDVAALVAAIKAKDSDKIIDTVYTIIVDGNATVIECLKLVPALQEYLKRIIKFNWDDFLKCILDTKPLAKEILQVVQYVIKKDFGKLLPLVYQLYLDGSKITDVGLLKEPDGTKIKANSELMKELGMTKPTFYRYKNQIEKGC